jgi:WD40 repeat protein
METGSRLFVSHSHEDDAFCRRLVADLRARLGDDAVWYDSSGYEVEAGLHGSEDWWDRILAEITERPYFLVVLSPSASASRWVPREMKIAYRQHVELGKRLLPVRLAESERREDWKDIQEFDFTRWEDPARYAAALAELLRMVGVDPGAPARPSGSAAPDAARSLSAVERLEREVHTAYGREHWSDVLDKTDILIERGVMPPALWRERASAAFALDNASAGLAAVEEALKANPDNQDTLLLRARLFVKANNDAQAASTFTRAYALAPLDDTATRLLILDDLTTALARLGRWDDFARRVNDGRRMAPTDPRWALREVEGMLGSGRYDEAISAARALLPNADKQLVSIWHVAITAAVKAQNWPARRALLDAAPAAGVDPITAARWRRFEFPRFTPLIALTDHSGTLTDVAWSPDGARLATASSDTTARIWEADSGWMLAMLSGHNSHVLGVAWAPDGARLATASQDNTARVWEADGGRLLATLSGHISSVSGVAWAPDGAQLATASQDNTARVWEADGGWLLATLSGHRLGVHAVAWAPDGARLATAAGDRAARVWEAASGRLLATLSGHGSSVWGVAWAPDGARLATASWDDTARVWEAASGRLLATLSGHSGYVNDVAWAPDGARLATASYDRTARVWEAASGRLLATLSGGHSGNVWKVAWDPNGKRLVTASEDKTAIIWGEE